MLSLLQDSKSAQLDGHIRIDSRPSGTPVLQWLSAILRMGSETDGRRYQATPGSWRSEGACLQRFPERCGIGVAISEEIVGLDRVGVARAVSGVIAPRLPEPPLEAGGLSGHVPWASGWPGGLTDEPQSATLRRPVHAAADTERCCGDRLFGPISRAFSARHAQWVFVIPKMLRPYFLHHRELLGKLSLATWETVVELMRAAVDDESFRPGMVAVVQTAGDLGNWHPHVHALVSRGGWSQEDECADAGRASRAARAEIRDARALRRSWAQLIKRIYEVDPLVCPSCGSEMKVIAFISEHDVVDAILRHLDRREGQGARAPPN